MRRIFVDANYFVAIFLPTDALHDAAKEVFADLRGHAAFVTTWACLTEFLSHAARRGAWARGEAVKFAQRILDSPEFEVIAADDELHREPLDLYSRRPDKSYSLVDCMSMVLCRRMKITEVLTGDADFQREGFTTLLR